MTVREALGGPWATHWLIWVGLFVPTSLLVLLRELATPFPEPWWPLVSAVVQHLVVGAIVIGVGAVARRRYALLPLALVAALWITAAVVRGVVGGALAAGVAGVEPEFALRSLTWIVGTVVWIPVVVYTVAQVDRRRLLLGAFETEQSLLEKQRSRANETGQEISRSLSSAVRKTLEPALKELVTSLESSRENMGPRAVAELSLRISQLHDRTSDLLEPTTDDALRRRPPRASVRRAFDVPVPQPWLLAALVTTATLSVILPEARRVFGELAALEVVVSSVAAGLVIGLVPWLAARFASESFEARGQGITASACVVAILVAAYLMLNSGIDPITTNGLLIVPLLAISLTLACVTFVAAINLANVNIITEQQLRDLRNQGAVEREAHDELTERERQRLADLLHGPVQGRLAACVMALNFSAADGVSAERTHELVDSVLQHLRAVARDLTSIAAADSPPTPEGG
ncbi:MAG: hypothetical protein KIT89_05805 [Microcella sp.]|uniref:hypothetical protein n=1 Tax=Microcella sp. TaxID=1913979 RepID=UPI0024C7B9C0|nr:hypothetical protein [Microcella sp.]UYN84679.1 MAG: hypothetical protein KIT89_05805 [Microcella sp.]